MSVTRRSFLLAGAAAPLAAATPLTALAQSEFTPNRPIRIVVGFGPGTPPEVIARIIADRMSRSLGVPMIIENRPGAAGVVAADYVTRQAADGYTLMLGVAASLAVAPHLLPAAKYDPVNGFTPLGFIQRSPYYITVSSSLPIRTLKDLVDAGRANPGGVAIAVPGLGTPHHLAVELLMAKTGVRFTVVPFPASPPMVTETLGGRVAGFLDTAFPLVIEQLRAGKLRQIAITDTKRSRRFPETATTGEQGYTDLNLYSWWGMLAPPGLPAPIQRRLSTELNAALASAEVKQRLVNEGIDEEYQRIATPAEFGDWIKREHAQAGEVIRAAGIKLQ